MGWFKHNCREVTRLVLAGEDRRLSWFERLLVRSHMKVCAACPGFEQQVVLMREAFGRWRAYSGQADG
jgi:hypothetical protein